MSRGRHVKDSGTWRYKIYQFAELLTAPNKERTEGERMQGREMAGCFGRQGEESHNTTARVCLGGSVEGL